MFTSFSTALSALNAQSTAVDVVGNNLANLNTPGYKASVAYFRDLVTQSLGAGLGETQVGFGVMRPLTVRQFTQGAVQSSSGALDAAIQGDGFFVVQAANGSTVYTRAGSFHVDRSGNLLTNTGEKVQGWATVDPVTHQVNTNGAVGNLFVPLGSLKAPVATTGITLDMNLDARALTGATSDCSTSIGVYDSLGTSHVLTISFEQTAAGAWSYDVTIPGADVGQPGTAQVSVLGAPGSITFDSSGHIATPAAGAPIQVSIKGLTDGAADMTVGWDLHTAAGVGRITQYAQASSPSANTQDGSAAAQLVKVGLGDAGLLLAQYSNGEQSVVGQVALAAIRNPESLVAVGNNNYQTSSATASPALGAAGTGGRGSVVGSSVEASTVDIAREFTNLIVLQRGYQANSRVITTVDEISQETIQLKR